MKPSSFLFVLLCLSCASKLTGRGNSVVGSSKTSSIMANQSRTSGFLKNSQLKDPAVLMKSDQARAANNLVFIENKGQIMDQDHNARPDIQFRLAASGGLNVFIGSGAIHYQFSKADNPAPPDEHPNMPHPGDKEPERSTYTMYRMDVELVGADKSATIITEQKQGYFENYYTPGTGDNGAQAQAYKKITYKEVYPHIDWVLYTRGGQLKHEFVVRKGGRVSDIKLKYGGVTDLRIGRDGGLVAKTPLGTITEDAPLTTQVDGKVVSSRFKLTGNVLSYKTAGYEGDLLIDPSLIWATYYGGTNDQAYSVAADASGYVYMTGVTQSASGIATSGAYQTVYGTNGDAFLVKFDATGARLWATYYGGASQDNGNWVATDGAGNVYLAGLTNSSSGISTPGAYQVSKSGGGDAFLVKFNSSGIRQWATYYGGVFSDYGNSVAADGGGNVYLAGTTNSVVGIASSGAYQTSIGLGYDAFLVKFDGVGTRLWATYYGGAGDEAGTVATDGTGNVYLGGSTTSTSGIASVGAYQTVYGGGTGGSGDAYLAKFDASGTRLWGTYHGGPGDDQESAVATDGSGNVYVVGNTQSTSGIASPGAYQTTYGGAPDDGFLVKFNGLGARQWATYYGGPLQDGGEGVATDGAGNVYMSGDTYSTSGIASSGAYMTTNLGRAYLVKFDGLGARQWGTYYAGGRSVATDNLGNIYIGGPRGASVPPSSGAFQTTPGGVFLAAFNEIAPIGGTASACVGGTTTLSDATTGGSWSSSNTAIATVISGSGVVSGIATGTSFITYTASGGSVIVPFSVVTFPSAGIISGVTSVCSGATVTLSDPAPGGVWSSGSANVSVTGSGFVTGIASGTAAISYAVTNACGTATTTETITIIISPAPIVGTFAFCQGGGTSLSDATAGGTWSSGSSGIAAVGSATGVLTSVVTGSVSPTTAIITYFVSSTGCAATHVVTVNPLPVVTGPSSVCELASISLSLTTGLPGTWSSSNTGVATVNGAGTVTGGTAGTTSIVYTNTAGCQAGIPVIVNLSPAPITGAFALCQGGNTSLSTGSAGSGTWSTSATTIATITAGGYLTGVATGSTSSATAAITYQLTATGCAASQEVTVNPQPAVSGPLSVCELASMPLTETTGTPGAWSSGNTGTATVNTAGLVTGAAAGTVYISYTATAGGCYSYVTTTVIALPAAITGPASICGSRSITLTDITSGGSWSSGATTITVGSTGVVSGSTLTSPATATVSYSLAGCAATFPVTVNPQPGISGASSVCELASISLAETTGTPGSWSSSGSAASVSFAGLVGGASAGTANITFTAASGGCIAYSTVTVNPVPASITGISTLCQGSGTSLSNATTGGTWSSSLVSVATITIGGYVAGTVTASTSPATATITYQLTGTGCAATRLITVNPQPVITGPLVMCVGSAITLLEVTGSGGTWSSSNMAAAPVTPISGGGQVSGAAVGTATIDYAAATGGCMAAHSITINAVPSPISGGPTVCQHATIILTDADAGGTWSSSAPAIASVGTGDVAGLFAGSAVISYSFATGCNASTTITVLPAPVIVVSVGGPTSFCPGGSVTLSSTSGYTYQWYNGATAIGGAVASSFTATTSGSFAVTATNSLGCSTQSAATVVSAGAAPVITPSGVVSFCQGGSTTLAASTGSAVGAMTYQWFRNGIAISGATSVTYPADTVGTYTCFVSITTSTGTCSGTTPPQIVTIIPRPLPVIHKSGAAFVTDDHTYPAYQWFINTAIIPGATTWSVVPTYAGSYRLQVTGSNGCVGYATSIYYDGGTIDTTTGTEQLSPQDVVIYPNPATSVVHISSSLPVRTVLSGVDGRSLIDTSRATDIPIGHLAAGLYFVTIYDEQGARLKTEKVVKE